MIADTHSSNSNAPYRNKQLNSMKGEIWKEIEGFDGYYLISNYGRVKSLPRFIEVYIPKQQRSITYYTKEKILSIKVHKIMNTVINQPYYECTVAIRFNCVEKRFMLARLVYHAFVKEIVFEKDKLMIMHKDGNGLNNFYKNLVAGSRNDIRQRAYDKKRQISPFALKTKTEIKAISKKAGKSRQKPVVQFNLAGESVKRFESIKEASLQTGIPDPDIIRVLKGNGKSAGGYFWKYD